MKIRAIFCQCMFLFLLLVPCNWAMGDESPDLRLVQTGKGLYSLQGSGYRRVVSTDVRIRYDAAILGNPVIEFGELATGNVVSNTSEAGLIRMISLDIDKNDFSPVAGTYATLSFDIVGKPAGKVSGHVELLDINGDLLATWDGDVPVASKEPGKDAAVEPGKGNAPEPVKNTVVETKKTDAGESVKDTVVETGKNNAPGMGNPSESGPDPGASSDMPGGNGDENAAPEKKEEGTRSP